MVPEVSFHSHWLCWTWACKGWNAMAINACDSDHSSPQQKQSKETDKQWGAEQGSAPAPAFHDLPSPVRLYGLKLPELPRRPPSAGHQAISAWAILEDTSHQQSIQGNDNEHGNSDSRLDGTEGIKNNFLSICQWHNSNMVGLIILFLLRSEPHFAGGNACLIL